MNEQVCFSTLKSSYLLCKTCTTERSSNSNLSKHKHTYSIQLFRITPFVCILGEINISYIFCFTTSDALNFEVNSLLYYYCIYFEILWIRRYFKIYWPLKISVLSKQMGDFFFQILWPSYNNRTFKFRYCEKLCTIATANFRAARKINRILIILEKRKKNRM